MAASVKLRLGDLFDGPSDLIVLPCSTVGGITPFVARSLEHYSIPHRPMKMHLGQVEIMPFEGAENIAQFVAFAASVSEMTSSLAAIKTIGRTIGEFTRQEASVRSIASPLLGAGAGGLRSEDVIVALSTGFSEVANADARLIIHVLHDTIFERLRGNRQEMVGKIKEPARVFISHTSKTDDKIEWVKQLARFLDEGGLQARLDKFHLRHGMNLTQWMVNELTLAQKVIVVCDEAYKQKADGMIGGVGWETMIVQGDLANLPPDSTKYLAIVRSELIDAGLPIYLRMRYAFHAPPSDTSHSYREELLRELLDIPLDERLEAREFAV